MKKSKSLSNFEKYVKSSLKVNNAELVYLTTDENYFCIYCNIKFSCEGSIYAHLTTVKHLGLPNIIFKKNPKYECNICGTDLDLTNLFKHICIVKALKNYYEIIRHVHEFGCPNMCLLCRGTIFETPAHLNMHMFIKHKWSEFDTDSNKNNIENLQKISTLKCPLCLAVFRTNNLNVLHLHAFEVHLPDIGIPFLKSFSSFRRAKYGSENDIKQWLTKQLFSCFFPNFIVKRFPITKCSNINRTLPAFNSMNCDCSFSNMINLTSHLCCHHFLNENNFIRRSISRKKFVVSKFESRINLIQKELDLKNRNLIERNIIIQSIPASKYCFECFKMFKNNFELQIHYLVAHSNYEWNICGVCNYDCTKSLSINEDSITASSRSNNFLWNALKIHEGNHIKFFYSLVENPQMTITKDLLPDFSEDLKLTLLPFKISTSNKTDKEVKSVIQTSNFTMDQKLYLTFLGKNNKNIQTDLAIADSLYN